MAIIDMFLGMDWAGGLMSPLVVVPVFVIAYMAALRVSRHFDDK